MKNFLILFFNLFVVAAISFFFIDEIKEVAFSFGLLSKESLKELPKETKETRISTIQCEEAFRSDFPEYKHVFCEMRPSFNDCSCETWDIKGAWENKNTRFIGNRVNIKKFNFDLKK